MMTISHNQRHWLVAALVLVLLATLMLNVTTSYAGIEFTAPTATGYEIAWYTLDAGGAQTLTNGAYTLSGTSGQFDAGMLSQTSYAINGGYWVDIFIQNFLPMILK